MEPVSAAHVLGLRTTTPTEGELRAAWRRFAREHHPDLSPAAGSAGAARFKAGRDAYEALLSRVGEAPPAPGTDVVHRAPWRYGRIVPGQDSARAVPYSFDAVGSREWYA